jgi:Adenylylsulphate kinase
VVREKLSKGLGFSKEDRDTNIFRIALVARMLSRNAISWNGLPAGDEEDLRGTVVRRELLLNPETGVPRKEFFERATFTRHLGGQVAVGGPFVEEHHCPIPNKGSTERQCGECR